VPFEEKSIGYPAAVIDRAADPRTEDTIVYELLRREREDADPAVVGTATFRGGRATVDAPEAIAVAVRELLERAFVDRVQADERPRGYRRSRRGQVDMLVPGMPEHFVARLRGLWLAYPDGSVVTARSGTTGRAEPVARPSIPDLSQASSPVTDPAVRRGTLTERDEILHARPLVRSNDPLTGLRPVEKRTVARTDCGWIA
jgi:hypothetical protein